MKTFKTEQEKFWAGDFGDEYISRNKDEALFASNIAFFTQILANTSGVNSVIEFGANIGLNLLAIRNLLPDVELSAIEINPKAVEHLKTFEKINIHHDSILNFEADKQKDLVLIKGVLIHINPDSLSDVYQKLYETSKRYICVAEYYNPTPVTLSYRGNKEKLFKRDFAGEMLEKFDDLQLIDYGFAYHRDNNFKQDDVTWFLLEKK